MKKLFTYCFLMFTLNGQVLAEERLGIEVSGKAEIEAVPDQFVARFSISERALSSAKAKAIVDRKSTLLINQIEKLDIALENIESQRISIVPIYVDEHVIVEKVNLIEKQSNHVFTNAQVNTHNSPSNKGVKKQKLLYQVSREIIVHLSDINTYEKLLDQATRVGVSRVAPVQMSISQAETLYQQVLAQAIVNAQEKAHVMAKQTGQKLGAIIYLKEQSYGAPARMMMSARSDESFQPQVGKKTISAQVIAKFALNP